MPFPRSAPFSGLFVQFPPSVQFFCLPGPASPSAAGAQRRFPPCQPGIGRSRLHFEEARTEEQFAALSLIHALGWRTTYAGAIPADFMAREITDDRWVPTFRENLKTNRNQLLLLYDEDIPVCCATFGPARIDAGLQAGTVCKFNSRGYEGWGEIISFYTHPDHKRKGYGTKLMEEVLRRLSGQGYLQVFLFVLRENENARRFYEKMGFAWDGTHEDIPFPPDTICVDLRYTRSLP